MSELPYDGDLDDPSQRCQHGTFIGSHWGPDYLCPACECPHDNFEDGICTYGCGYRQDGTPEPRTLCDWEDVGPDMDGSRGEFPCGAEARHTIDTEDQHGPDRMRLCATHMSKVLCDDRVHARGDEVWLDGDTRMVALHIGQVLEEQ